MRKTNIRSTWIEHVVPPPDLGQMIHSSFSSRQRLAIARRRDGQHPRGAAARDSPTGRARPPTRSLACRSSCRAADDIALVCRDSTFSQSTLGHAAKSAHEFHAFPLAAAARPARWHRPDLAAAPGPGPVLMRAFIDAPIDVRCSQTARREQRGRPRSARSIPDGDRERHGIAREQRPRPPSGSPSQGCALGSRRFDTPEMCAVIYYSSCVCAL